MANKPHALHVFEEKRGEQEGQSTGEQEQQWQRHRDKWLEHAKLAEGEKTDATCSLSSHSHSSSERLPPRRRAANSTASGGRSIRSRSGSRPRCRAPDTCASETRSSSRFRHHGDDETAAERSSRTRSMSRSRQRSSSKPRQPSSRSRSRPRPSSMRRQYMARFDAYFRSAAGLRLQKDGTCAFEFGDQRFTAKIEATGEFQIGTDLGSLDELQWRSRPRNFLKMLAKWNQGLSRRHGEEDGEQGTSGRLRIDASEAVEPRVAFILYGHVANVKDPARFAKLLDDLVDDALDCAKRIDEVNDGWEARGMERIQAVSLADVEEGRWEKASLEDQVPDFAESDNTKDIEESKVTEERGGAGFAAADSHHSLFSSSDVYHATSKNRFKKLFGVFSRSGNNLNKEQDADPVIEVDPTEEGFKPKIVLSRKAPQEREDAAVGPAAQRQGPFNVFRRGNAPVAPLKVGDHEKSFNQSIDIFDGGDPAPPSRERWQRSEPAVGRQSWRGPLPPASRHRSSRRSSVADAPRQRRPVSPKGRGQGRPVHRDDMSQSEPVMARWQ